MPHNNPPAIHGMVRTITWVVSVPWPSPRPAKPADTHAPAAGRRAEAKVLLRSTKELDSEEIIRGREDGTFITWRTRSRTPLFPASPAISATVHA
jgi:hypothetical protein